SDPVALQEQGSEFTLTTTTTGSRNRILVTEYHHGQMMRRQVGYGSQASDTWTTALTCGSTTSRWIMFFLPDSCKRSVSAIRGSILAQPMPSFLQSTKST